MTGSATPVDADPDVMAAVDAADLVIADVERDDAWLSMPASGAPALADWR